MTTKTTTQKKLALRASKAPDLPVAPVTYSQQYQDQLANALRQYFAQVDNATQTLSTGAGAIYLGFPYGSFSSTATLVGSTTGQVVPLTTTDFANGVALANNTLTFTYAGIYNIQYSVQLTNTGAQEYDAYVYLRKDGAAMPYTNSVVTIQKPHGTVNGHYVLAANFFVQIVTPAHDTISLMFAAENAAVEIEYISTGIPAGLPAAPSAVVTASFVSAL